MATETQFNIDTENAFNQFWGNVIIHGKDEDIRKFEEYVKEIVRNKIGKFVIAAINNKLGILSQNQRHLDIEMDNQTSDFTWPTLKSNAKIKFSNQSIECDVIRELSDSSAEIVKSETQPHVLLFHEILHWARYLTCIENPLPSRDSENSTSFFHPILSDHPKINCWVDKLKEDYAAILNNRRKRILCGVQYQIVSRAFPELNCWKSISQNNQPEMIQLSSHCIDLITNHNPKKDDSAALNLLRMPCLSIEEIRNIVGGGDSNARDIDDVIKNVICENGYRLSLRLPLRYGHVQETSTDQTVAQNKVIDESVRKWYESRASLCDRLIK